MLRVQQAPFVLLVGLLLILSGYSSIELIWAEPSERMTRPNPMEQIQVQASGSKAPFQLTVKTACTQFSTLSISKPESLTSFTTIGGMGWWGCTNIYLKNITNTLGTEIKKPMIAGGFRVPRTGFYIVNIQGCVCPNGTVTAAISLQLDGASPVDGASTEIWRGPNFSAPHATLFQLEAGDHAFAIVAEEGDFQLDEFSVTEFVVPK